MQGPLRPRHGRRRSVERRSYHREGMGAASGGSSLRPKSLHHTQWINQRHRNKWGDRLIYLPTYSRSRPVRRTQALPLLPARAVRPHRWENAFVSDGGSNCRTTSTSGRSSPLAATSVARSMEGEEGVQTDSAKELRVRVRAAGGRCPWSE